MDIIHKEERAADRETDAPAAASPPAALKALGRENEADEEGQESNTPKIRTGHDAGDVPRLRRDPTDEDAKLDVALDETFPTSDAPSITQPCKTEPAPSSGYDEAAEEKLQAERMAGGD